MGGRRLVDVLEGRHTARDLLHLTSVVLPRTEELPPETTPPTPPDLRLTWHLKEASDSCSLGLYVVDPTRPPDEPGAHLEALRHFLERATADPTTDPSTIHSLRREIAVEEALAR